MTVDAEKQGGVTVMTMNVLSFDHADGMRRSEVPRDGIRHLRPDVIALQETTLHSGHDQAADLLGNDYVLAHHSSRSLDGVGATLGSRWPVAIIQEVDLHVVLLGDFDDVPESSSIRFWTGKQSLGDLSVAYRDAWSAVHPDDPGHTFTPSNPLTRKGEMSLELGRRIDYIMVRCGVYGPTLEVADCQLALDKPTDDLWASDHFGVIAHLTVPTHPPGAWTSGG